MSATREPLVAGWEHAEGTEAMGEGWESSLHEAVGSFYTQRSALAENAR